MMSKKEMMEKMMSKKEMMDEMMAEKMMSKKEMMEKMMMDGMMSKKEMMDEMMADEMMDEMMNKKELMDGMMSKKEMMEKYKNGGMTWNEGMPFDSFARQMGRPQYSIPNVMGPEESYSKAFTTDRASGRLGYGDAHTPFPIILGDDHMGVGVM